MEYPHWLIIAGAILLMLGLVGLALRPRSRRLSRGFVTLLTEIRGTNCAKRLGIEKGRIYATLAGQNLFGMKCSPGKSYITVFHKLEDSVVTRRGSRRRPRRWGWRAPEPPRHSCAHL